MPVPHEKVNAVGADEEVADNRDGHEDRLDDEAEDQVGDFFTARGKSQVVGGRRCEAIEGGESDAEKGEGGALHPFGGGDEEEGDLDDVVRGREEVVADQPLVRIDGLGKGEDRLLTGLLRLVAVGDDRNKADGRERGVSRIILGTDSSIFYEEHSQVA